MYKAISGQVQADAIAGVANTAGDAIANAEEDVVYIWRCDTHLACCESEFGLYSCDDTIFVQHLTTQYYTRWLVG